MKEEEDLSKKSAAVLQWIPAHCGIAGKETADRLAKEGGRQTQHTKPVIRRGQNPHQSKTAGHQPSKRRLAAQYQPTRYPTHRLDRAEQTASFRLRTGHCGLKAHLKRIGIAASALCDCSEEDQTTDLKISG